MRTIAAITLTLATALPATAQPVMYSVLDLGTGIAPFAINASGQTTGSGPGGAFRGSADGQITYLGAGGGGGIGINASGQVAGVSNVTNLGFLTTATGDFSTATDLGPLGGSSRAQAVNDIGQVVGSAQFPGSPFFHAVRTTPGGVFDAAADLGTLGGDNSNAFGINAAGQVTGRSYLPGNTAEHAFRTTATGTLSAAQDLGTLGGTYSCGAAINASGEVAGSVSLANGSSFAFRSSPNGQPVSIQDLDPLGAFGNSGATGINALGVVVGILGADTGGFVDYGTQMYNLNNLVPSGWDITQANGINDAGQIVAEGSFQGGPSQGVVLTPIPVPEPAALALTGLAGVWLGWRRLTGRSTSSTRAATLTD